MTSSPHGLYIQGYTRATMVPTKSGNTARWSESQKRYLSSDRSLQLGCVKLESLVIVDQRATVNTSRALYTPPVTPWELTLAEYVELTFGEQACKLVLMTGVKS